jgi:predicted dithiol-disulfide oxidoreductase (DUF899 family)
VSQRGDKGVFRICPSGGKAERVVDLEFDRALKGRNETGVWFRRHNEYDKR